jgi:hypothetical protein
VIDFLFRKKLFRSKATASPGLEKQNKFICGNIHCVHMWTPC